MITDHRPLTTDHRPLIFSFRCPLFYTLLLFSLGQVQVDTPQMRGLILRNGLSSIGLMVALALVGCSVLSHQAATEDVDKAAALFFQRLDNQDFNAIYDDCSKRFKTNKPRQTILENLGQLAVNGKTLDFQRTNMPIEGQGSDRIVSPVYKVVFEQMAGEFTLNFQDESGEWKLLGFAFKPRRQ